MITNEQTVSCDVISVDDSGNYINEQTGEAFDAYAYSRLKYGSLIQARTMGARMGSALLEHVPDVVLADSPPEAVVVYKAVPPACHALSRFCIDTINGARIDAGLPAGTVVRVIKSTEVRATYASASPEERLAMLDQIELDTDGHSFDDKNVIVIDDIRITGSAERHTRKTLDTFSPTAVAFGYIALFNEAAAMQDASVEDRINHVFVKGLSDIATIQQEDGFLLNIRVLKRVLSPKEAGARGDFLAQLSDDLLYDFYSAALSCGPDFLLSNDYLQGFTELKAHAAARKLI